MTATPKRYSLRELVEFGQLEVSGRAERVRIVQSQVAAKRRPEHDLLRVASTLRPLCAIVRALTLLEQRRAELPADLIEKIEGPL